MSSMMKHWQNWIIAPNLWNQPLNLQSSTTLNQGDSPGYWKMENLTILAREKELKAIIKGTDTIPKYILLKLQQLRKSCPWPNPYSHTLYATHQQDVHHIWLGLVSAWNLCWPLQEITFLVNSQGLPIYMYIIKSLNMNPLLATLMINVLPAPNIPGLP